MNGAILFYLFVIVTLIYMALFAPILKSQRSKRKTKLVIVGLFTSIYIILGTLFPFYTDTEDVNQEILLIALVLFCYAMAILNGIFIFKPIPKFKAK